MVNDARGLQSADPKFQPLQIVKIRSAADTAMKDAGLPIPVENSMGETGVVEMGGKVYVRDSNDEATLQQVYFVRIDGIGPVLTGEGWLEDALGLNWAETTVAGNTQK